MRQSVFVVPAVVEVARRRGLFEASGLDVSTERVSSSSAQWQDLESGRAELAITAIDNLLAWNAAGSDIAVVAQIETTTDLALVLRPSLSSIEEPAVVRLAVDAPTNGFAIVAYAMMVALGRAPAQYDVVEVGGVRERFDALVRGDVDASLLAPPLDEVGRERGMTAAMRIGQLTPSYPGLGVVARRSWLDSHLDDVAAYLRALDDSNRWLREAPRDQIDEEFRSAGFGAAAIASSLSNVPATLEPSREGLRALGQLRQELDMTVPGAPDVVDLADLRALEAARLLPAR